MANGQRRVKATADIKKNRLHVVISGTIDAKTLEKLYTDVRFCVADLKKGFNVVSDVSDCNLLYITGLPIYKKIIDFLIGHQVGAIVRIIRDDNVSFKQLINFSEQIHCYRALYAESREEAEQKLEELAQRDGLRFSLSTMPIQYERNGQTNIGSVIDISVSGCDIQSRSAPPAVDDELGITIEFGPQENPDERFQMRARVVRSEERNGQFAVQFLDLDEEHRDRLYKRLAGEVSKASVFPPKEASKAAERRSTDTLDGAVLSALRQ
ncbi:PilZ domain-containing protein [Desulfobulbus elongatus]|uniref:PilZ domain-containing protein n=1 Tax=Desulfobulbus elongatus TaxID=53332 RepID=UPI000483C2D7|nr:PilZ domain-containing protein [Desulfobulbus elongatus]